LRHTAQVADASIAAGDIYSIVQSIEGQMVADARFGTASAWQIVVRFGVRSSLAGTFGVRLTNSANNRSYVSTITIAGGEINTDLVRTIVIPGDTSGTWLTDTGIGLQLAITIAAGTTFQGTAGSWQGSNITTTSGQTNFMGTGAATFELFDVGLYVDHLSTGAAPSWELPAPDADLRACQRYYCQTVGTDEYHVTPSVSVGYATTYRVTWPVPMRVAPVWAVTNNVITNVSSASQSNINTLFGVNFMSGASAGNAVLGFSWTANARF
jgi:hypothetical protein